MKARWFILGAPIVGIGLFLISRSEAFDHSDGPQTVVDPATDVTDLYAFMRPEPLGDGGSNASSHLVLVATFDPTAAPGSTFTPQVTYQFRIRPLANAADLSVAAMPMGKEIRATCTILNGPDGGPQQLVQCAVNGQSKAPVAVGELDAGGPESDIRVFAGLRADPAFADRAAIEETVANGQLKLKPTGTNAFADKVVRALVVEFNVNRVGLSQDASTTAPATAGLWAVSVETVR